MSDQKKIKVLPVVATKYLPLNHSVWEIQAQLCVDMNGATDLWEELPRGFMWEQGVDIFDTYSEALDVVLGLLQRDAQDIQKQIDYLLARRPLVRRGEIIDQQ